MRGGRPQPTRLKILHGNPGKRAINKQEPKPGPGSADPPPWLEGVAADEWRRLAPMLHRLGLLTEIDGQALAAYCQTYARWRDAEDKIKRFGTVMKGKNGMPVISPFFSIADRTARQLKAYLIEFGMTPSARSRVRTPTDEAPADPFAEFDYGQFERWTPDKPASG